MSSPPLTRRCLLQTAAAPLAGAVLGLGACLGSSTAAHAASTKERVTGTPTDFYMGVRKAFKSNLLRKGPAPQPWQTQTPPPGVEKINYQSGDHTLTAWIAMPRALSTKNKAVIFLHGGFAFDVSDFQSAQAYLDAGYAVIVPILRGENGQPGHFSLFYDEVDDVLGVLSALQKRPDIDANEIFVAGHSTGGTLSLLSGMATTGFKGIASFSGSPDQFWFTDDGKDEKITPFNTKDQNEFYVRSPLFYVQSLQAPTRYFHGTEEENFSILGENFAADGQSFGLNIKSVPITGNHFTFLPEAIKASIDFFDSIE